MVLGSHARTSSAYGPTYTCEPLPGGQESLIQDLLAALHTLPADIYVTPAPAKPDHETLFDETIRVGTAAEGATIKEGSYLVVKDRLAQIVDGMAVAVPIRNGKGSDGIPARHARIIRGLVQIRDAVRAVLRAQEADLPWGGAQVRLRGFHAHFKREFGPINLTTISETAGPDGEVRETVRRPNLQPFLDDPDVWLVASIEDYDVETGVARQGPIFTERVLHPPVTPEVTSAADALAVALHETGVVDHRPRRRASRRHARGGDRGAREPHIPRPAGGPLGLRGLADGRRLSLRPGPQEARDRHRRRVRGSAI